jgi:hypothetical protein
MSKSAATSLANAINLKPADLPAYQATPAQKDTSDEAANARFARCIGAVPESKDIVNIDSPDFSAGAGTHARQLSSNVTVLPSAALAAKDLAAARSPRTRTCLRTFVNALLSKSASGQVTFSSARITRLHPSAKGSDGAFGYRVRVVAKGPAATLPFYVDILAFTKGPVEVSLTGVSITERLPSTLEQRLLDTLASRAQGHAAQT